MTDLRFSKRCKVCDLPINDDDAADGYTLCELHASNLGWQPSEEDWRHDIKRPKLRRTGAT